MALDLAQSLDRFVGIPFVDRGRDFDGVDCWGLVRLVYDRAFGIRLPCFSESYESANDRRMVADLIDEGRGSPWRPVIVPKTGDVAVIRRGGLPTHVGVVVGYRLLHADRGAASSLVPLDHVRIRRRLAGYYRHEARP